MRSAIEMPVFMGTPSERTTSMMPDIAWITVSKAGLPGYREQMPNPDTPA